MFFRKPHPWDGQYAIPDYVMAEPPGRGTATTKYRRRKSIDNPAIPTPWQPGYAYPNYVGQEPIGRGVHRTKYYPRKSIDVLVPKYLGDDEPGAVQGKDPIANFGQQVASRIMSSIRQLPVEERKPALKAVFDQLDPKLWGRVAAQGRKFERQGLPPKHALHQAIAASTSMGLLEEFIRAGQTGRVEVKSMLGLAAYGEASEIVVLEGMQGALGAWYNPLSWVAKGVSKATATAAPAGMKAAEWGKGVISSIGSLACNVAGSRVGQLAASGGAAAAGAPPEVGQKGANLVASACADQPGAAYAAPAKPFPLVPVLVAGGAVLLIAVVALK
ncbi:MAG: hypothetical protein ACYSWU_00155 [Planctomycetota bacterium]|jgi:hypothetical protein